MLLRGLDWRAAIYTVLGVYFALVLHEIAHGLVALWNGDTTAKNMGRLSMNPVKHFDLVGLVMMLAVGFGYAKPVPVNPYNFKHYRRGLFTVAIAGICMNLLLAFFGSLFSSLFFFGYMRTIECAVLYRRFLFVLYAVELGVRIFQSFAYISARRV